MKSTQGLLGWIIRGTVDLRQVVDDDQEEGNVDCALIMALADMPLECHFVQGSSLLVLSGLFSAIVFGAFQANQMFGYGQVQSGDLEQRRAHGVAHGFGVYRDSSSVDIIVRFACVNVSRLSIMLQTVANRRGNGAVATGAAFVGLVVISISLDGLNKEVCGFAVVSIVKRFDTLVVEVLRQERRRNGRNLRWR